MNEVNIILSENEDGTLGVRILANAAEGSGPATVASMFVEFLANLQEQEQKKQVSKIITSS